MILMVDDHWLIMVCPSVCLMMIGESCVLSICNMDAFFYGYNTMISNVVNNEHIHQHMLSVLEPRES